MKKYTDAGLAQLHQSLNSTMRDLREMERNAIAAAAKAEKELNVSRGVMSLALAMLADIEEEQARRAQS